jgi:signal transduction histidine kinase
VPLRTEEQLLRIGQEAMVNAVRHARAEQVVVELEFDETRLTLRVQDDGQGFDAETATANGNGHYGLTSMRERAEHAGGTLIVKSVIGHGTRIEASVPAPPQA